VQACLTATYPGRRLAFGHERSKDNSNSKNLQVNTPLPKIFLKIKESRAKSLPEKSGVNSRQKKREANAP